MHINASKTTIDDKTAIFVNILMMTKGDAELLIRALRGEDMPGFRSAREGLASFIEQAIIEAETKDL